MKLTIGSLFAGIGAFDLGFHQAGFETLWQCEIDPQCQKLLANKFPNSERSLDVQEFNPDDYECPDVITFGSPCQDLSVAGQRSGINGERSGLFFHATRIIRGFVGRGLQFALWENVPGVLNSNGPRDFAAVLGTLGQCGALDIGWAVLDAQWFGLAQRRKRVFLVADFRSQRAAEILSLSESLRGDIAPSRETGQRVAPTVEGRACRSGANNFATSGGLAHALRSEGADASEDGTGRGTPIVTVPDCARNERAQSQSSHREDSETYIPVAAPLGSHHRRDDLDNDTYVVNQPINEVSPALKARDCKGQSSDGFGDGAPLIPVSVTPIQSVNMVRDKKQNGIGIGQPGDEMFTLTGRDQHAVAFTQNQRQEVRTVEVAGAISAIRRGDAKNETLLAFSSKDSGNDATNDLAPTLRSQNFKDSHMNGGGQVAIAFTQNQIGDIPGEDVSAAMGTNQNATGRNTPKVCATITKNYATHHGRTAGNNGGVAEGQLLPVGSMVRRLTPTECERLMGFPDGYTSGFSDSVRYKMLGNSLAVPIAKWIAERMKKALT